MFNALSKTVTCDSCGKSLSVEAQDMRTAEWEVAKKGWEYAEMGEFRCPECKGERAK